MNLYDYLFTDGVDGMFSDFMVVDQLIKCHYCGKVTGNESIYKEYKVNVRWLDFARSDDMRSIQVVASHDLGNSTYLISTSKNTSTYHCMKCKEAPVAIKRSVALEQMKWCREAAEIVKKDLGVEFNIIYYSRRATEGGYVTRSDQRTVNINLGFWQECSDIKLELTHAIAHEARHLWQYKNEWVMRHDMPYHDRPEEIDAYKYSEEFYSKYFEPATV